MSPAAPALSEALDACVRGHCCRRVTVLGPLGAGTSRLVRGFAVDASSGAAVLSGRCLSYGQGITWWPVREMIARAAGITEDDDPDAVRAAVSALLGGDADDSVAATRLAGLLLGGDDAASTCELFWSVRRLLERLAADRPVVVVFDELQWAEDTLLDLIDDMAAALRDRAVLLVCIAHPEFAERRAGLCLPEESVVHVRPLSDGEGQALASELLGGEVSTEITARVHDAAGGIPLFITQLLRVLVDDGLLHFADGRWDAEHIESIPLPTSISAVFAARLDQLEPVDRRLLERASVIGEVFYPPAVAALTPGIDPEQLARILDLLVADGLIERDTDVLAGEQAYRFCHGLLRDAAYTEMLPQQRAELHERFAAWLEEAAPQRAPDEILGYHLEVAHRHRRSVRGSDAASIAVAEAAVLRLHRAGHRALEQEDWPAAVNLLGRAMTLARSEALAVPGLALDVVDAAFGLGDLERLEALRRDAASAPASPHGGGVAEHAYLAALLHRVDTGAAVGERQYHEVLAAVDAWERAGESRGQARAWHCLAIAEFARGAAGAAALAGMHAVEYARAAGTMRDAVQSACLVADALRLGPEPAFAAMTRIEELRELFPGSRIVDYVATGNLGVLHTMRGDIDKGRALARRSLQIVEQLGHQRGIAVACGHYAASVELLAGDLPATIEQVQRSIALTDRAAAGLAPLVLLLIDTLLRRGEGTVAREYLELIRSHALIGDPVLGALWRAERARALSAAGDHTTAVATAADAVALGEVTDFLSARGHILLAQAAVCSATGDGGGARRAAMRAAEVLQRKENLLEARAARQLVPA